MRGEADGAPVISVIIAAGRQPALLARCLDSLLQQESAPPFELLVGVGQERLRIVVGERFPNAFVTELVDRTPAAMRNVVLPRASGELLLFLDDDVVADPHLLQRLAEVAGDHPETGVFGGPNITPPGSSLFQVAQGAVLSSIIGAGPVRRRYGPHPSSAANERWFTLCNLAVRRDRMSVFDAVLVSAEENGVLEELSRRQVPMLYTPDLVVHHERRSTWSALAAQIFKYGRGRGQLIARRPRTARPLLFPPVVFLFYLALIPFAFRSVRGAILFAPLAAYLLAIGLNATHIAWTLRRVAAAPLAAALTVLVHFCYGSGVLTGVTEGGSATDVPAFSRLPSRIRLLRILVVRQLRLRRKRSPVGMVWPLFAPLMLLGLYVFVFRGVFQVPIQRYPEFLFAGLLPWVFLTQTLGVAVTSLSFEAEIVRRARFPYELVPIATVIAMSPYFLILLVGFTAYLAISGHLYVTTLPLIVFPVASLFLFVAALALLLALIDVFNRDIRFLLANILTVWFFLVPIVYRQDMLGSRLLILRSIDPVNIMVGQFRGVLYLGRLYRPDHLLEVVLMSALAYFVARTLFRRLAPKLPLRV